MKAPETIWKSGYVTILVAIKYLKEINEHAIIYNTNTSKILCLVEIQKGARTYHVRYGKHPGSPAKGKPAKSLGMMRQIHCHWLHLSQL